MTEKPIFIPPQKHVADDFLIRGYLPSDGEHLVEALDASYEHLKTFMPWAVKKTALASAAQRVNIFRGNYLLNKDFVLAIFDKQESRLLGGSGFHMREGGLDNRSAEIGMWIRSAEAGKGLGTRALREILKWGFSAWPWERLAWRCSGRNLASQRTAEKAGLRREGTLRGYQRMPDGSRDDVVCFAILRADFA